MNPSRPSSSGPDAPPSDPHDTPKGATSPRCELCALWTPPAGKRHTTGQAQCIARGAGGFRFFDESCGAFLPAASPSPARQVERAQLSLVDGAHGAQLPLFGADK